MKQVKNDEKLALKDMPAEDIKAILNSDNVEVFCNDNSIWVVLVNSSIHPLLYLNSIYRTKPLTPSEQLEEEKAIAKKEAIKSIDDLFGYYMNGGEIISQTRFNQLKEEIVLVINSIKIEG